VHVFVWTCEHTCVCVCVCVCTHVHTVQLSQAVGIKPDTLARNWSPRHMRVNLLSGEPQGLRLSHPGP
jgi:hypothetical protein